MRHRPDGRSEVIMRLCRNFLIPHLAEVQLRAVNWHKSTSRFNGSSVRTRAPVTGIVSHFRTGLTIEQRHRPIPQNLEDLDEISTCPRSSHSQ
jgi:hypothetical protein